MKDKILDLYLNKNMKQNQIAKKLNISTSKVSRILKNIPEVKQEKDKRKFQNKIKHNKDIQTRVEEKRKATQFKNNVDDLILKHLHSQASLELSKRSYLSDGSYRKWNVSAYNYNPSKHRYEFNESLGRSYDVPKFVKER